VVAECGEAMSNLVRPSSVVIRVLSWTGPIHHFYSLMALVVLLRGVNVGGHRRFRPSLLAHTLRRFEVVNIGAAGTFVVRRPGTRSGFRAALSRALPTATDIVLFDGAELRQLEHIRPFGFEPAKHDVVRFVSFLSRRSRNHPPLPIQLPEGDEWLVRVVARTDRFVFGEYRRHMRTISHLGRLDKLFGVPVTTRNSNTVESIVRVLGDRRRGLSP
jgi:uncharacterized protein (DUF1697 family)